MKRLTLVLWLLAGTAGAQTGIATTNSGEGADRALSNEFGKAACNGDTVFVFWGYGSTSEDENWAYSYNQGTSYTTVDADIRTGGYLGGHSTIGASTGKFNIFWSEGTNNAPYHRAVNTDYNAAGDMGTARQPSARLSYHVNGAAYGSYVWAMLITNADSCIWAYRTDDEFATAPDSFLVMNFSGLAQSTPQNTIRATMQMDWDTGYPFVVAIMWNNSGGTDEGFHVIKFDGTDWDDSTLAYEDATYSSFDHQFDAIMADGKIHIAHYDYTDGNVYDITDASGSWARNTVSTIGTHTDNDGMVQVGSLDNGSDDVVAFVWVVDISGNDWVVGKQWAAGIGYDADSTTLSDSDDDAVRPHIPPYIPGNYTAAPVMYIDVAEDSIFVNTMPLDIPSLSSSKKVKVLR